MPRQNHNCVSTNQDCSTESKIYTLKPIHIFIRAMQAKTFRFIINQAQYGRVKVKFYANLASGLIFFKICHEQYVNQQSTTAANQH